MTRVFHFKGVNLTSLIFFSDAVAESSRVTDEMIEEARKRNPPKETAKSPEKGKRGRKSLPRSPEILEDIVANKKFKTIRPKEPVEDRVSQFYANTKHAPIQIMQTLDGQVTFSDATGQDENTYQTIQIIQTVDNQIMSTDASGQLVFSEDSDGKSVFVCDNNQGVFKKYRYVAPDEDEEEDEDEELPKTTAAGKIKKKLSTMTKIIQKGSEKSSSDESQKSPETETNDDLEDSNENPKSPNENTKECEDGDESNTEKEVENSDNDCADKENVEKEAGNESPPSLNLETIECVDASTVEIDLNAVEGIVTEEAL